MFYYTAIITLTAIIRMMSWLTTLPLHNYDLETDGEKTGINIARQNLAHADKEIKVNRVFKTFSIYMYNSLAYFKRHQ